VTTPAWQAPVTGYPGNAGHLNQLLAAHNAVCLYPDPVVLAASGDGSGVYQSTAGQWLGQEFTVPATAPVTVQLQVSAVGGSPADSQIPPLVISVYADGTSAGAPGPVSSPLASAVLAGEYVYEAPFWVPACPALGVLTAGTSYWLVTAPAGDSSHYYAWQQAATGAASMTAPDGVTWTAQSFPLMLQLAGAGGGDQLAGITEDYGARVTTFAWSAAGELTGITEYTAAQDGTSFVQARTITYESGFPVGVS
jgi:hypothetical protein